MYRAILKAHRSCSPGLKAQVSGCQSAKGKDQGWSKPIINLSCMETCSTPNLVAGDLGVMAAVGRLNMTQIPEVHCVLWHIGPENIYDGIWIVGPIYDKAEMDAKRMAAEFLGVEEDTLFVRLVGGIIGLPPLLVSEQATVKTMNHTLQ